MVLRVSGLSPKAAKFCALLMAHRFLKWRSIPNPTSLLPRATTAMSAFSISLAPAVSPISNPGQSRFRFFQSRWIFLAALSSEGVVSLFDPLRKKLLRTMDGGEAAFNLAFNADGTRLAASCGDFAFVWDVSSGQQLLKATHAASSETLTPMQWIYNAAISADGKLLAYAARGDSWARVWNVETGRQILELKHDSAVAAVSFNADGTKLGTGSYDGTARVWELPSGSELERASLSGGSEVVSFSPAGDRFAAGGVGGSVLSPRRAAPTAPPTSTCPPRFAALPSARMASASRSAQFLHTIRRW